MATFEPARAGTTSETNVEAPGRGNRQSPVVLGALSL
jgi:hypothetical protein